MTRSFALVITLTATISVPASATDIYMSVSAYADDTLKATSGQSYALIPDETIRAEGLEYRRYASQVERLLAAKGMSRAVDPSKADIAVLVSYGIGDPKEHHFSYALPFFNTPTSFTPLGVTSWIPISSNETTYHRWLKLSAVTPANTKAETWRVDVNSDGSIGDLREIFPYLLFAASPYIAKDTGKAVNVKAKHEGKEIKQFLADATIMPKRHP